MTREEVWMRAWVAVASCFNGSTEGATRFADSCLRDFEGRFAASCDTHPKDGDVKQAPLVSGAVPKADAQTPPGDSNARQ